MPKVKAMSPDIRRNVRKIVAVSSEAYLQELSQRIFKNPSTPESRSILLEGLCDALHNLTRSDLTGKATLLAFAHQLLEQETPQ